MYRHIFTTLALTLTVGCAPVVPVIADEYAENAAKILADSLTDAIQYGDLTRVERILEDDFQGGTARFEYQDDAWVGRISGDTIWSVGEEETESMFDLSLDDFGGRSEQFSGALDMTQWQVSDARSGYDGFILAFDGTLDSSVSGPVDVDLTVLLDVNPGYRGIEWSGTVDDEFVSGHVEEKEERDRSQDDGCKAPIGVDCE